MRAPKVAGLGSVQHVGEDAGVHVVQSTSAVRPGFGRIESISAVPPSSAAAGGTTMRRLGIKMEDGSMQYVDTAAGIAIGERVELTSDGKIRH